VTKPVRLLLPAEHELFDAACYYEKQAPGLGQDFLNDIETALRHIMGTPERWPVVNAGIRRSLIRRFPYSLLYRVDPDEIVVLAVMHQKRHPAYWLSRKQLK
jgi:plasmid stabilization system protein ParE